MFWCVWGLVLVEAAWATGFCVFFTWAALLTPEQFKTSEQTIWNVSVALVIAFDVVLFFAHTTLVLAKLASESGGPLSALVGKNRTFFFSRICVWFAVLFTVAFLICAFDETVGNAFQTVCLIPAAFFPVFVETFFVTIIFEWVASMPCCTHGQRL